MKAPMYFLGAWQNCMVSIMRQMVTIDQSQKKTTHQITPANHRLCVCVWKKIEQIKINHHVEVCMFVCELTVLNTVRAHRPPIEININMCTCSRRGKKTNNIEFVSNSLEYLYTLQTSYICLFRWVRRKKSGITHQIIRISHATHNSAAF